MKAAHSRLGYKLYIPLLSIPSAQFCRFLLDRPKSISRHCQSTKKTLFWPKFLRQNFEKKQAKIAFLGTFWSFFGARSHLKIVFICAKVAFRNNLGSVCHKWISQNRTKGGPFGSAGVQILKKRSLPPHAQPPPPIRCCP